MFLVQRVATIVGEAFIPMPLLTELGSNEDGFHYRPGAPNGAVPKPGPPPSTENSEEPIRDLSPTGCWPFAPAPKLPPPTASTAFSPASNPSSATYVLPSPPPPIAAPAAFPPPIPVSAPTGDWLPTGGIVPSASLVLPLYI